MTNRTSAFDLAKPEWFFLLREQRQRRRVSRKALALECGLSEETVRAYEFGRRGPRRETLEKILAVLSLGRAEERSIMQSAGFSTGPTIDDIDLCKLKEFGEQVPWPQAIASEDLYILSVNSLLSKVTQGQSIARYRERQSLVSMADPRIYSLIVNWEEVLSFYISLWKKAVGEELPMVYPWMPVLTQRLSKLSPPKLGRFYDLWDKTEPISSPLRSQCDLFWRDPELGEMRLRIVNSSSVQCPGLLIQDLLPTDASSWRVLELIRAR